MKSLCQSRQTNRSCTMKCQIFSILFLIFTMESQCLPADRFFITAPGVFHVGVKEKVFVQMGPSHLNQPVTLYLEHETQGIVSAKETVECADVGEIKTVELMIDRDLMSLVPQHVRRAYLRLMAESPSFSGRKSTNVLVSKHSGSIFIQTDQPIYNPAKKVKYRIFTLDHTFRPYAGMIKISVFNAAGNRVMKVLKHAKGGILRDTFPIPDISKPGTWKITAHYLDDEANAASREFKVQKFVLPSFEVNIVMRESYIMLNSGHLNFTISAKYSHGEKVTGAYHCSLGVVKKSATPGQMMKPEFIKGLTLTGSVKDGIAEASIAIANLEEHLPQNLKLSNLQQMGSKIYLGVFVTNVQSGEIQEAEVYLPIISNKYTLDLSQTRSHYLPGFPLDVVAVVRHPDGSPATDVPVTVTVSSEQTPWQGFTDQRGAVSPVFNIRANAQVTVEVSAGDLKQSKVIHQASSPSNSYLYLSFTNKMYSVGELLSVTYSTITDQPSGYIYYMVLSRGILIKMDSLKMGISVKDNLRITADMVPSFRLIGYYYDKHGNIIADSVWIDVRDECQINAKIHRKGPFKPGRQSVLEFDLHGESAKVALLAVDKAIYGLHVDNKLTPKQVFSSMQSYDLGCSYSGGSNPASVLVEAGLSFVSQSNSQWKRSFSCPQSARLRRAVDIQGEMLTLRSNFSTEKLQKCCVQGFSLIPMKRTCQQRMQRVSVVEADPMCAEAFLKCCLEGERLRLKKMQEDARRELGRTESMSEIELFFLDTAAQYIRRYFPPSFAFTEFNVKGKGSYSLALPDSITTWEIQVVTVSPTTGFCVVEPTEVRAFKDTFVSLTLPYSVRKYEQLSISPVIYNYGVDDLQLAVHMEQVEGLCSPGSATTSSFVNVTVGSESSQFVSFSAVPMVIGSIPIKIRVYNINERAGLDAVEKTLNVLSEGLEKTEEITYAFKFGGRSSENLIIDGTLPDGTVPDSQTNIFVSAEGDGFGSSHAKNLLSPEKVAQLIILPTGCLEQTMVKLAPTASAIRYLDLSEQWFDLPAGARDDALDKLEQGYIHIVPKKKENGAYGTWRSAPYSNWMTALVVKVLSLIAERQTVAVGQTGRQARLVPYENIRHPVSFLLRVQEADGSFGDPNPVLHKGILSGLDRKASMTAFITLALRRSLPFLETADKDGVESSITRSTEYLQSQLFELEHSYAVAITVYCLAVSMPTDIDHSSAWAKLQGLATEGKNGCYLWPTSSNSKDQEKADAITVDATGYALLAAVELGKTKWADKIACWLTTQENYLGGFKSSQDTITALEALAEYELKRSTSTEANLIAQFTVSGKTDIIKLELEKKTDRVETDLKKFTGNEIDAQLTGQGNIKLKVLKSYHLLEPKSHCNQLSISVTVEGKVKYTAMVLETYEYYDEYGNTEDSESKLRGDGVDADTQVPQSEIEWFDARSRSKRDLSNNGNSEETVTYTVCVSHNLNRNLTGMGVADITLLSGFEAVMEDLERLKGESEQYISHYELLNGRVLLYFNELFDTEECLSFDAVQKVPIGLLQPAPAAFYDYYEPSVKCTVFYSAPKRSKMVSKLCSEDVCQCAERPCHKVKNTFQSQRGGVITSNERFEHACFHPTVDYAYIVEVHNISMKSNFELYQMTVKDVLRSHGDILVNENSARVFAKRRQCKGQLELGQKYLVMGKDGSTTDSHGMMQYLLESNTWVERKPSKEECAKSTHQSGCAGLRKFRNQYKVDGCRQ